MHFLEIHGRFVNLEMVTDVARYTEPGGRRVVRVHLASQSSGNDRIDFPEGPEAERLWHYLHKNDRLANTGQPDLGPEHFNRERPGD